MPDLKMPKTAEEATEVVRDAAGDYAATTCLEDHIGDFRYETSAARQCVRSLEGALLDPEMHEAVWNAAEQLTKAADQLIERTAVFERFEKAAELLGRAAAYEILLECVRGEDVAQPTVKEAVAGDREIDELMEA